MEKTTKIILSIAALAGAAAAIGVIAYKSGSLEKLAHNYKKMLKDFDLNEKLKLIAHALDKDIKNTERRVSAVTHENNRKKYEKMEWDGPRLSRDEIECN